jgi:hypothetical protein
MFKKESTRISFGDVKDLSIIIININVLANKRRNAFISGRGSERLYGLQKPVLNAHIFRHDVIETALKISWSERARWAPLPRRKQLLVECHHSTSAYDVLNVAF